MTDKIDFSDEVEQLLDKSDMEPSDEVKKVVQHTYDLMD